VKQAHVKPTISNASPTENAFPQPGAVILITTALTAVMKLDAVRIEDFGKIINAQNRILFQNIPAAQATSSGATMVGASAKSGFATSKTTAEMDPTKRTVRPRAQLPAEERNSVAGAQLHSAFQQPGSATEKLIALMAQMRKIALLIRARIGSSK
jgi:hypothetical protein